MREVELVQDEHLRLKSIYIFYIYIFLENDQSFR